MIPLTLLGIAAVALTGVVAIRRHAGTVFPFAPAPHTAADTMASEAETVFANDGWQSVTLTRLRDVEDLLDSLEAHHVANREVCSLGDIGFRVRWK